MTPTGWFRTEIAHAYTRRSAPSFRAERPHENTFHPWRPKRRAWNECIASGAHIDGAAWPTAATECSRLGTPSFGTAQSSLTTWPGPPNRWAGWSRRDGPDRPFSTPRSAGWPVFATGGLLIASVVSPNTPRSTAATHAHGLSTRGATTARPDEPRGCVSSCSASGSLSTRSSRRRVERRTPPGDTGRIGLVGPALLVRAGLLGDSTIRRRPVPAAAERRGGGQARSPLCGRPCRATAWLGTGASAA